jgi:hypothetical protein
MRFFNLSMLSGGSGAEGSAWVVEIGKSSSDAIIIGFIPEFS